VGSRVTATALFVDAVGHHLAPELRGYLVAGRASDVLPYTLQTVHGEPDNRDSADDDRTSERHPLDCYKTALVRAETANRTQKVTRVCARTHDVAPSPETTLLVFHAASHGLPA
jgi:hypothetical protein